MSKRSSVMPDREVFLDTVSEVTGISVQQSWTHGYDLV